MGKEVPKQAGTQFLGLRLTDELAWSGGMRTHASPTEQSADGPPPGSAPMNTTASAGSFTRGWALAMCLRKARNSTLLFGVGVAHVGADLAGRDLEGCEQCCGAVADVAVGLAGRAVEGVLQLELGAVQSLDLALLVDRDHDPATGGARYSPTTARILGCGSGSVERISTSRSDLAGCSTCARSWRPWRTRCQPGGQQPRRPVRYHELGRRFPLVCRGFGHYLDSSTSGACPGRGRSPSPSIPASAYRLRHFTTVGNDDEVRSAISVLGTPSAASTTILARCTTPAGAVDARATTSSRARLPSRSRNGPHT